MPTACSDQRCLSRVGQPFFAVVVFFPDACFVGATQGFCGARKRAL
jgi:hypothetical protein